MKFSRSFLQEMVVDGVEGKVSDTITSVSRWSVNHRMVFLRDGKFYVSQYSRGATEVQDESPYEYSADEVECPEVHGVERTVIVYELVQP